MKINAIQGMEGTINQNNTQSIGSGEDFSSYLQGTASLEQIFDKASRTYNVPKNLIKAIAKTESDFRPNVTSKAGAQGIMQIMPSTAQELGVTDAYDPYQNIMGGTKYFSQLLQKYEGNINLALAAYNAGTNNVAKYGGIPPFEETQNFVVKINGYMNAGIDVPDVCYSINTASIDGTADVGNPISTDFATAASITEAQDNYLQDILDQLFSYEEYLHFIDLYTKMQEAEQHKVEKEQQQQQGKEEQRSDAYFAYQELRYSPIAINLIGDTNIV